VIPYYYYTVTSILDLDPVSIGWGHLKDSVWI
jgi:hypothetical protein